MKHTVSCGVVNRSDAQLFFDMGLTSILYITAAPMVHENGHTGWDFIKYPVRHEKRTPCFFGLSPSPPSPVGGLAYCILVFPSSYIVLTECTVHSIMVRRQISLLDSTTVIWPCLGSSLLLASALKSNQCVTHSHIILLWSFYPYSILLLQFIPTSWHIFHPLPFIMNLPPGYKALLQWLSLGFGPLKEPTTNSIKPMQGK